MGLIIPDANNLRVKVVNVLRDSLERDEAPYLISLVFPDGHVRRQMISSEKDIENLLIDSGVTLSNGVQFGEFLGFSKRLKSIRALIPVDGAVAHDIELIIEQIMPATRIIIFGAGHVGKAVVQISAQMGWDVVIIDDRLEFLDRVEETGADINRVNEPFGEALRNMRVGKTSALVIVTRGHQFDEVCLEESLETEAFYVGMIGSRRRVTSIMKKLEEKGLPREKLLGIHTPIGIDINARTPQEIAISIIAEIIRVKNSAG